MLALLLLACSTPDPMTSTPTSVDSRTSDTGTPPTPPDLHVDGFLEAAAEAGFATAEGLFTISDYAGCCDDGARCLGNNQATPYGTWALPAGEGEAPRDYYDPFTPWSDIPEQYFKTFRLREDEAVVWVGVAPPEARYFAFRSYLGTRVLDDGTVQSPLASLGPSNNNLVIAEQLGKPIWNEPLAFVTTANATVEEQVVSLLEEAGWDRKHVVRDRLPMPLLRLGLDADADTIQVVSRAAIYDDPDAGQAWLDDPVAHVFRVTPGEPVASAFHPDPVFLPRGTGVTESDLAPSIDALEAVLRARYDMGVDIPAGARWQETLECIETLHTCAGDLTDRLAMTAPSFFLDPTDDDAKMVVWGVNHYATGKAAYSNISVTSEGHGIGIASRTHLDMPGTAAWFGYEGDDADLLYAFLVSRDCSREGGAPCMEVAVGCPGAEVGESMRLTGRAYLEEPTMTAPHEDELVIFRAAKVH